MSETNPNDHVTPSPAKRKPKKVASERTELTAADGEMAAQCVLDTPAPAAVTISKYLRPPFDVIGFPDLAKALQKQVAAVNKGDMKNAEGLLTAQVYTLDAIFHRLATRAQYQEDMGYFDQFLKLAFRAQNQCRATLETLATIKNPPNVAFVRQANIANNQQINNDAQAGPPAAGPPAINSTPQLEQINGNYLDTRTATAARGDDPSVATVGEVHRPKDARGQG